MRATALFALFLGGAVLFGIGCNKEEPSGTPAPTAAPANADSTGVPECDQYFKEFRACAEKNPEHKASIEQTLTQMTAAFKAASQTPEGKAGLKTQCEGHLKMLPQSPFCAKK